VQLENFHNLGDIRDLLLPCCSSFLGDIHQSKVRIPELEPDVLEEPFFACLFLCSDNVQLQLVERVERVDTHVKERDRLLLLCRLCLLSRPSCVEERNNPTDHKSQCPIHTLALYFRPLGQFVL